MGDPRGSRPTVMHEVPGADLVIDEVHADSSSEYVSIVNRGQIDQPLTGWVLASLHGLEVFQFPEGTVLPARGRLRVLSGEGAGPASQRDLLWTRQSVWNNRSDTAFLFDDRGHEVTRFTYPRPTVRESRVPKRKILMRERDGYHLQDWDELVPPGKD